MLSLATLSASPTCSTQVRQTSGLFVLRPRRRTRTRKKRKPEDEEEDENEYDLNGKAIFFKLVLKKNRLLDKA